MGSGRSKGSLADASRSHLMSIKLTLSRKGVIIISIPFLIQILFFLTYGRLVEQAERLALNEYRSKAVIGHANWLVILLSVATNSLVGYSLTNDRDYLLPFNACLNEIP